MDNKIRINFQNVYKFLNPEDITSYEELCSFLEKEFFMNNIKNNYKIEVIFFEKDTMVLNEENFNSFCKEMQNDDLLELLITSNCPPVVKDFYFLDNSEKTPYIWNYYENCLSVTLYNNTETSVNGMLKINKRKHNFNTKVDPEIHLNKKSSQELIIKFDFNTLSRIKGDIKTISFQIKMVSGTIIQDINLHVKFIEKIQS